jgi:hypothetical protein
LPIGNLTSQLFANVYLHPLDLFIKNQLWFRRYGRYVDDFFIFHTDKQKLLEAIPLIRWFLADQLFLILHPKKIYLQQVQKGVQFLGAVIKPYRSYLRKRTVGKRYTKIQQLNTSFNKGKILSLMNSYLWMCQHHKSFHLCKKMWKLCNNRVWKHFSPEKGFRKIHLCCRKIPLKKLKDLFSQWYSREMLH